MNDAIHLPEAPQGPLAESHKVHECLVQQADVQSASAPPLDWTAYLFGDASLWSHSELGVGPHLLQSEP